MFIAAAEKSQMITGYFRAPSIPGFGHGSQSIVSDSGHVCYVPPYDLFRSLDGMLPITIPLVSLAGMDIANEGVMSNYRLEKPQPRAYTPSDDIEFRTSFDVLSALFAGQSSTLPQSIQGETHLDHHAIHGYVVPKGGTALQAVNATNQNYDNMVLRLANVKPATFISVDHVLKDGDAFTTGTLSLGSSIYLYLLEDCFRNAPAPHTNNYSVSGYSTYRKTVRVSKLSSFIGGIYLQYSIDTYIVGYGHTYESSWECKQTITAALADKGTVQNVANRFVTPFVVKRFYEWERTGALIDGVAQETAIPVFTKTLITNTSTVFPIVAVNINDNANIIARLEAHNTLSVTTPTGNLMSTSGSLIANMRSAKAVLHDQLNSMVAFSTANAVERALAETKTDFIETAIEAESAINLMTTSPPIIKALRADKTGFVDKILQEYNHPGGRSDEALSSVLKRHMLKHAGLNGIKHTNFNWKWFRSLSKEALRTYLAWVFGVTPIINLISEADRILDIFSSFGRGFKGTAYGKCTTQYSVGSSQWWDIDEITVRTKLVYEITPYSVLAGLLPFNQLGLTRLASSTWAVMPWSWIIDAANNTINKQIETSERMFQAQLIGVKYYVHSYHFTGNASPAFLDYLQVSSLGDGPVVFQWFGRDVTVLPHAWNGVQPAGRTTANPKAVFTTTAYAGQLIL